MRSSTWRGLLAITAALLLFAAACGDDGDDTGATSVGEQTDDGGDTSQDDGADDDGGDDDGGDTTTGGGGLGDQAFCAQIGQADRFFDAIDAGDETELPNLFGQARDVINSIDPPAEIAADWAEFSAALNEAADLFERFDFTDPAFLQEVEDNPELIEEFERIGERFEDLEESGDRISEFVLEECGIDLDS